MQTINFTLNKTTTIYPILTNGSTIVRAGDSRVYKIINGVRYFMGMVGNRITLPKGDYQVDVLFKSCNDGQYKFTDLFISDSDVHLDCEGIEALRVSSPCIETLLYQLIEINTNILNHLTSGNLRNEVLLTNTDGSVDLLVGDEP